MEINFAEIFERFGFPVAMVIVLLIYIWRTQQQHREELMMLREETQNELKDIRDEHKQEVKELTKAVNKQSELINELITLAKVNMGVDQPERVNSK